MSSNTCSIPSIIHRLIFLLCYSHQLLQLLATMGNETDLQSLMVIKNGVEGLSSWNQSFHFCQWQGIRCGKRHQRVITLNLSGQNLVGPLSPCIGNLSFLRFINLNNNRFYGNIPPEIGRLSRLQHFNVSNTSFTGNFPVNLTRCTDLRIINIQMNPLSGNLPAELGSLSKLVFLDLFRNNIAGELPHSLGNRSSLEILVFGDNNFHGNIPYTYGRLSKISAFLVETNKLSGVVPLTLYNISSIWMFSIAFNQFTGSLPLDIGTTLPNLIQFLASSNQLSGNLPVSLANSSNIERFDVSSNNFIGEVPRAYGSLQKLSGINLEKNHLGSGGANDDLSFITSLTNASSPEILSVSDNILGGFIPNSISNLTTRIALLYLGGNKISGIIPRGLGNLVNLIGLGLDLNNFHGSIPSSIGNLQNIQKLSLGGNRITGVIPSSIANATQLSYLDLSRNKLEGNIPSSLGGFRIMQFLDLSVNNLSGTIPTQIFSISSLSIVLNLYHNSFSGSLPNEIGNLQNLGIMDVSENKLTGEIPSTLAGCVSLDELYLENNLFEGRIPSSLRSLNGISYMDLSNNNLYGLIPKYLENFTHLQMLNLSFNKFEGEVPTRGIFKNGSVISVDGNMKLCGGTRELRLPTCQMKDSKSKGKPFVFPLAVGISVGLFFLLASLALILCWKRKVISKFSFPQLENHHFKVSYRDLFQATEGFSPTNFIGSGSFCNIYKGILVQKKLAVAIKVFNLRQNGSSKTFMDECESLRNIRHRNLVKLLTSCSSMDFQGNDFKALVFEFMENGSLEKWLHQDGDEHEAPSRGLNLTQRLNIAIDVASGLQYLHHECHIPMVHRDLKPSNILLDSNMVAHVGDFGLAKFLLVSGESLDASLSTSTFLKGTIGYAAPEYGMGSAASTKADVYSYGILLLEMFTGRRPTDEMFRDGSNIHAYATEALPDQVVQIVDPKILSEEEEITGNSNRANFSN